MSSKQSTPYKTIGLMSGGMDSTFAVYWARQRPHINLVAGVFINYGQKGAGYEWQAAKKIGDALELPMTYMDVSDLHQILTGGILRGERLHRVPMCNGAGQPTTFVPGRNLLHLALLAPIIYKSYVQGIVGGWNAIDVGYPDCSAGFLGTAAQALSLALGRDQDDSIHIFAPAIAITKAEEVTKGTTWSIPWALTRSCYGDDYLACGQCHSCLVRTKAFYENGLQDPAYHTVDCWEEAVGHATAEGFITHG